MEVILGGLSATPYGSNAFVSSTALLKSYNTGMSSARLGKVNPDVFFSETCLLLSALDKSGVEGAKDLLIQLSQEMSLGNLRDQDPLISQLLSNLDGNVDLAKAGKRLYFLRHNIGIARFGRVNPDDVKKVLAYKRFADKSVRKSYALKTGVYKTNLSNSGKINFSVQTSGTNYGFSISYVDQKFKISTSWQRLVLLSRDPGYAQSGVYREITDDVYLKPGEVHRIVNRIPSPHSFQVHILEYNEETGALVFGVAESDPGVFIESSMPVKSTITSARHAGFEKKNSWLPIVNVHQIPANVGFHKSVFYKISTGALDVKVKIEHREYGEYRVIVGDKLYDKIQSGTQIDVGNGVMLIVYECRPNKYNLTVGFESENSIEIKRLSPE